MFLAQDKHLAASSIAVAVAALRFLYTVTLKRDWLVQAEIPSCRQSHNFPNVLSREEVGQFLDAVTKQKHRVILTVCYAARTACVRGGAPDARSERQPTHGYPRRRRQETEGSLRDALAQVAGHSARLLCGPSRHPALRREGGELPSDT